jgi:protein-tyrosine phosphatase
LIDIHTHILWGLDDGAKTKEDSLAMLRIAADAGTIGIVASPHADLQFKYDAALVDERIAELTEESTKATGGVPKIYRGCDFHLTIENIQDAMGDASKYTINRGPYLLVEFADIFIPPTTDDVFRQFLDHGVIPVLTHPERNPILQHHLDRVRHWVEMGCLVQVTAQSLTDRFGKAAQRTARKLLRDNLVHVLASDAHDTVHRPPRLDAARAILTREFGAETANLLLHRNPEALVMGTPAVLLESKPLPAKHWYEFWR